MAEAACSGDMRNYSHEFIVQFIELYKSYPCLWKIKSKEYSNKTMKQEAYEVLVQKLREVDVNADKHAVVKRINNLRSCYRKEAKKVKKSMLSGSGVDSVYVPKLWYYKYLHFLYDQELPSPSTGNMSESEEENKDDDELTERENMSPFSDDPPTPLSSGSGGNLLRKRKAAPSKQDELLTLIAKKIATSSERYHGFGLHVVEGLRNMDPEMAIYCQKVINEALCEGQLGRLTRQSTIVHSSLEEMSGFIVPE